MCRRRSGTFSCGRMTSPYIHLSFYPPTPNKHIFTSSYLAKQSQTRIPSNRAHRSADISILRPCKQVNPENKAKLARAYMEILQAREAAKEEEAARIEKERKMRRNAMVEESEGVAWNIAKAEKAVEEEKAVREARKARGWMDVVMG